MTVEIKQNNTGQTSLLAPSTIAIIGGMGKAAARQFDSVLDQQSGATKDQDFPPTVIIQNSHIEDRTESIQNGNKNPVPEIVKSIHAAERMGIKKAIMSCNTAHYFIEEIRARINLELLDMIEITSQYIAALKVPNKQVGLIATTGTIQSKVYHRKLSHYGIEVAPVSPQEQDNIHSSIYGEYNQQGEPLNNGIKSNPVSYRRNVALVQASLDGFKQQNIQHVILGCTEFSVIRQALSSANPLLRWIDPLECSAQYILKKGLFKEL